MKRFTAFIDMGDVTVTVLPRGVSKEQAEKQVTDVCRFMMQFLGGTQSIRCWIEPTV